MNIIKFIKKMKLYCKVGITRMKPLTAYRMVKYFVLTNILKKEIPWVLEFSVTYACQCKCEHCSVSKYTIEANMLTNDEIKRTLDQAAEIGIPKVDFFGGEPLMRKGIVDLIAHASNLGLYVSVTTNGWMLSREMVKDMKRAGINCVNVSIDSDDEVKHDELRGLKGVFKRAVEGIRYCHEEGIPCIVSTYVTRERIENFAKPNDDSQITRILNLAKEIKATGVRILFPIISGSWEEKAEQEFTDEEKALVIDNLDPSFAFIEGAFSVIKGKKVCQSLNGKMFDISPQGDLQICVAFHDLFGNVREMHLRDALNNMWNHPTYLRNKGGNCCSTRGLIREGETQKAYQIRGC